MDSFKLKDLSGSPGKSSGASASRGGPSLLPPNAEVSEYQIRPLGRLAVPSYEKIKSSFKEETQKATAQFHVSEFVLSQLSVEDEERRRRQEEIENTVQERLEGMKQQAYQEAFEAGMKEGRDRGYQEARAAIDEELAALKDVVQDLALSKETLGARYQKELANLAVRLAGILVHYQIQAAPEEIFHTVAEMMDHVSKSDDVVIRISKHYAAHLAKIQERLAEIPGSVDRRIHIELSETLKPGDAIVECMSGEVASFMKEKIQFLQEKLMQSLLDKGGST